MPLPIAAITKLLAQLTLYTPMVNDSFEKIGLLIEKVKKPGANSQKQLDDLKQAIELQLVVNTDISQQLAIIKNALEKIQGSLKTAIIIAAGAALIAVIALVLSVTR